MKNAYLETLSIDGQNLQFEFSDKNLPYIECNGKTYAKLNSLLKDQPSIRSNLLKTPMTAALIVTFFKSNDFELICKPQEFSPDSREFSYSVQEINDPCFEDKITLKFNALHVHANIPYKVTVKFHDQDIEVDWSTLPLLKS